MKRISIIEKQKKIIRSIVIKAIKNEKAKESLGLLSKTEVELIKKTTGIDLTGFERIISADDIKHAFKKHSNPKVENQINQIAITYKDFELIPEIIKAKNLIYGGKDKMGNDALLFSKNIGGKVIYIETIKRKSKILGLKTMYKKKPPK